MTPKPNINQLSRNGEKDRKVGRRGIKAWLTFSKTQKKKKARVPVLACACCASCLEPNSAASVWSTPDMRR